MGSVPEEKYKPAVLYANRAIPGRGARQTEETQSNLVLLKSGQRVGHTFWVIYTQGRT